jgi:hypothetical protein
MARGFESKSVESQQADRERRDDHAAAGPTPEEAARQATRKTVELARARAAADLTRATHPSHRASLEAALKALDEQLRRLQ